MGLPTLVRAPPVGLWTQGATMSYAALAKRAEYLRFAREDSLQGVKRTKLAASWRTALQTASVATGASVAANSWVEVWVNERG
jgi:hypothetical protein